MAKKDQTALLIKAIKSRTKKWESKFFKAKSEQTKKAKELSELLGGLSHGKTDKQALAKILSLATGEDVVLEAEEDVEFRPVTALVLTKLNTTDFKHNYETEQVLISIGDGSAISPNGVVGNFIPKKRNGMRPATEAEIDGLTKEAIAKLHEEANLVFDEE